jgi:hypothetical protein
MDEWPFSGVHDKKMNAFKEKLYVVNLYLWIGSRKKIDSKKISLN